MSTKTIAAAVVWLNANVEGRVFTYQAVWYWAKHGLVPAKKIAGEWYVFDIEDEFTPNAPAPKKMARPAEPAARVRPDPINKPNPFGVRRQVSA